MKGKGKGKTATNTVKFPVEFSNVWVFKSGFTYTP